MVTPRTLSLLSILVTTPGAMSGWETARSIRFEKTVVDTQFRSEGVALADVNRDGKPDVLAGNVWYQAPDWKPHEIAPVQQFDKEKGYSNSFLNYSADANGDGWLDQIVIGFPGSQPVVWRENPKGRPGPWPEHVIFRHACNESPAFAPLFNAGGSPLLVFSYDNSQMAWFEPGKDLYSEFISHPISQRFTAEEEQKRCGVYTFYHGLGVGDVNSDGRADVLVRNGYWEGPRDPRVGPWNFVFANFGQECAQMHVYDVNADGLPDVLTSSAHKIGVWWHEQHRGSEGVQFVERLIDDSFSQSHSLVMADVNGDGLQDIVTGKRFWAHGPNGDIDPNAAAVLYWYELERENGNVKWIRHEIDNDSGVGTQFVVADVDGDTLADVVTANKKGVFVFIQRRKEGY